MRKALVFILLLSLVSCKKNSGVDLHESYFPDVQGHFVIYEAQDIFHDQAANVSDTTNYWLKVLLDEDYIDNEGRLGREYKRFISTDQGATWSLKDVWHSRKDILGVDVVEENHRLRKLVFAPIIDKEWDVNAANTRDELTVYYEDVHVQRSYAGKTMDSTLTVRYQDFFSLVDYNIEYEVYAKDVGLVQLYRKDLIIKNFDTLDIDLGTENFLLYLDHGVE